MSTGLKIRICLVFLIIVLPLHILINFLVPFTGTKGLAYLAINLVWFVWLLLAIRRDEWR